MRYSNENSPDEGYNKMEQEAALYKLGQRFVATAIYVLSNRRL